MAATRIKVCITIDTEFSIGGHFDAPELRPIAEPMVLGRVGGKEQGLGFLLASFAEYGFRATFFIEALQTAYFGDEPMGEIARRIAQAGHDAQLHLHPCWLSFEPSAWGNAPASRNDSCAGRGDAELDFIFAAGLSAFSRWRLPRPTAVRPGNFQANVNFYRAAARAGVHLSSSIALPLFQPSEEALRLTGGKHRIEAVLEFPLLCYTYQYARRTRIRPLAITACSRSEMISVLWQAQRQNVSPVIILTHPQEFIKRRDPRYETLRRNRVNQTRLKSVLQFLDRHRDAFEVVPISAIDGIAEDAATNPVISMPLGRVIARMVENGINDRLWWY